MRRFLVGSALAALAAAAVVAGPALPVHKVPADARVYIVSAVDGAAVGHDVTARFGLPGWVSPPPASRSSTPGISIC